MKKFSLFQKILIGIMSVIFVATITLSIFKASLLQKINTDVFNMVSAVRYTFFESPVKSSNQWLKNHLTLEEAIIENDKLKENVASIGQYQAEIDALKAENKELNSLLDFKNTNTSLDLKSAQVTFRDYERWNNIIKINVGINDDVKVNDAVVLADGLIGRVESVEENSSVVRLLFSNEIVSKVAIKIEVEEKKYVEGIVDLYDANLKRFKLSLLETSDKIKKDQKIITSGSGGSVPSGILVGYISSVEPSVNELGDTILVNPSASFNSFEKVFVVRGRLDD